MAHVQGAHFIVLFVMLFPFGVFSQDATSDGTLEHKRAPRVDPMAIFVEAMENLKPLIGVAGIKKGGATYKVICHTSS